MPQPATFEPLGRIDGDLQRLFTPIVHQEEATCHSQFVMFVMAIARVSVKGDILVVR